MKPPKEKRRGGVFDDSVINIFLNREQLEQHLKDVVENAKSRSENEILEDYEQFCFEP